MSARIVSKEEFAKFLVKPEPGRAIFLDLDDIYYIEAEGDDTLVRTARKRLYKHVEPLDEVEARLPSPPFFRIHRSYVVNLNRVLELRERGERDTEIKLDPPVNRVLPVSRPMYTELKRLLRI